MINNNLLATVSWRKYLLPRNQRVKNFLESRGEDVFWQICQNIHEAYRDGKKELVIMIHPNLSYAIHIPKKDFVTVLNTAITEKRKIDKTLRLSNVSNN